MSRASGQLASAAPGAPTAPGRPDEALLPVIWAARMPPTARLIEWPVLPHTWAANSAPMRRARDQAAVSAVADSELIDEVEGSAAFEVRQPLLPPGLHAFLE